LIHFYKRIVSLLRMPEKEKEDLRQDQEVQVRLVTKLGDVSVPDSTLTVPSNITTEGLNTLIQGLLAESTITHSETPLDFEWLCLGELVRGKLSEHVDKRTDITAETVIELEYIEKNKPPEPQISVNHDDWVSAVRVCGDLVLTGCYDNTVNIWNVDGEKKLVIPSHVGPVKAVAWVERNDSGATFVSTSHDQTVNLFNWNSESNSVEGVNTCRGHERSVECVAVSGGGSMFATGSFDNTVKVWGARIVGDTDNLPEGGSEAKKSRGDSARPVTRTPLSTLGGHKEAVAGVAWLGEGELASASWDHTIKVWDTEMGGLKTELVGNKAFFSVSYSPVTRTLLATGADRSIRLYDPRSNEGSLVKAVFTSHVGWVTAVHWSEGHSNQFVSSSHDQLVKVWDQRSYKTPLYELTGHSDKVLCCDWSNKEFIASGGADNDLKIFRSKVS